MSSTPLATSTAPAQTTVAANNGNNTVSFVGNTPSTVLFFLAMAVGVAIAFLFVFFTVRFFVRSTFGLNVYGLAGRGITYTPRQAGEVNTVAYTDREIYEHLEYLRVHHFLREEFLERRFFTAAGRRRRRRRRRRGRFSKMKKLPQEDVDRLFPKCQYADWLNNGESADTSATSLNSKDDKSDASSSALGQVKSQMQSEITEEFQVLELVDDDNHNESSSHGPVSEMCSSHEVPTRKVEAHYDSGSCSICLDTYESDDIVRGLICGHVFHADCVDPWLTLRRACCPICKRDYYKETRAGAAENTFTVEESHEVASHENADQDEPAERLPTDLSSGLEGTPGSPLEDTPGSPVEGTPASPLEDDTPVPSADDITDGQTTQTAEPVNEDTDNRDRDDNNNNRLGTEDLDYDFIRSDASIQALFSELIPLSERVRVISDEFAGHGIEARARQRATDRYGKFFKVIFWKLMGVTKKDLYNWAVIDIYRREHVAPDGTPIRNPEPRPETPAAASASMEEVRRGSVELTEMSRSASRGSGGSVNQERSQEELELEAHARDSVEQRV